MRSVIPGATFRVVLLELPPAEGLDALEQLLGRRDLAPDEVARALGSVPAVVATQLTEDQGRVLVRELMELGARAEMVNSAPGVASLDPAAARIQRDRQRQRRRSRGAFFAIALVGLVAAVALMPTTTRQRFVPETGSTMRFQQFLDIEHSISRGTNEVMAKGTWEWTLERTVVSATEDEIVVRDRFVNPVHNFRVLGSGAGHYRNQLSQLAGALANNALEQHFDGDGKRVKRGDDSAFQALDPHPAAFGYIFHRLHFPARRVKMGKSWTVALTEVRGLHLTLAAFEDRLGVPCARVPFEVRRTFEDVEDQAASAATQESIEGKGTAWIARDTGWLIEAEIEIESSFHSVAAVTVAEQIEISARHRWLGPATAPAAAP